MVQFLADEAEKMVTIQEEAGKQGLTLTHDRVVEKVLKRQSGYVQILGLYAVPTTSSRSTATSKTFETKARLRARVTEIKESF